MADAMIIPIDKDAGIKVKSVTVLRTSYLTDGSGNWMIEYGIILQSPERIPDTTVVIRDMHRSPYNITGSVIISGAEMAALSGIPHENLRSTMTVEQLETVITQIALMKVFASLGISLA